MVKEFLRQRGYYLFIRVAIAMQKKFKFVIVARESNTLVINKSNKRN